MALSACDFAHMRWNVAQYLFVRALSHEITGHFARERPGLSSNR